MKAVRYALVLLIVGVVAGGVLAYSNSLTAPIIAEQEKAGSFAAFQEIFTDADDFVAIDEALLSKIIAQHGTIQEILEVKSGDDIVAYVFNTISGGYGGGITTISGFNLDGTVEGIRITENSETPGLGTRVVDDPAYQESYIGKSISEELVLSGSPASDSEVLLLSGATVSSQGVLNGVNDAREAFVNFLAN
ncbi:MAG: FMN-binding protein [Tissierellia bacterium]|nr:FMN-binding protein [Tissierellia bacterium]